MIEIHTQYEALLQNQWYNTSNSPLLLHAHSRGVNTASQ